MPLPEAAALLGITPHAVRARIRRGLLRGRKGNRTWLVELPADFRSAAEERLAEERRRDDEERRAALAEGERDVARAEAVILREALAKAEAEARADRLEAALAEARRPLLLQLLEAVRRK